MKKIKTIFIQVRTSEKEKWLTIGTRGSRYTDFTQTIREYDFIDFFNMIKYPFEPEWECDYFIAKYNIFTGSRKIVCLTRNMEMTNSSCSKIFIKQIAIEQDLDKISLKSLFDALPAKDFIEFIQDNVKNLMS